MSITKATTKFEQEQALKDLFEGGRVVQVYCGQHMYFPCSQGIEKHALIPPTPGTESFKCPNCWKAYFLVQISNLPPEKQGARLEELDKAANHACEMEDAGLFDFIPYIRPKIEFSEE